MSAHKRDARANFRLTLDSIELFEIAPGIELKRVVMDQMNFVPCLRRDPTTMPPEMVGPAAST